MDALLEQAVQGMKKNGFEVVEVRTAAEACDYLLAHIDAEKSVGVGGSVSVRDTGVLPATISAMDTAIKVITGISALRRAWPHKTPSRSWPRLYAVRM